MNIDKELKKLYENLLWQKLNVVHYKAETKKSEIEIEHIEEQITTLLIEERERRERDEITSFSNLVNTLDEKRKCKKHKGIESFGDNVKNE